MIQEGRVLLLDFSNIYQSYFENLSDTYGSDKVKRLDFSHISGTNCCLDDVARAEITGLIDGCDGWTYPVRFMDSGNFHYMSLIFMEKLEEDFDLLLFDNHTDLSEDAFGNLLTCGSWVDRAIDSLAHLGNVYLWGVGEDHLREAGHLPDNVRVLGKDESFPGKRPIYVSIDKDVFLAEYAATDWDQGSATPDEVLKALSGIDSGSIVGLDICGEKRRPSPGERLLNESVNNKLLSFLREPLI